MYLFFAAAVPAIAEIGGGSAAVGSMTTFASIGSSFATAGTIAGFVYGATVASGNAANTTATSYRLL
ncbi:MAG: hypothetical protein ORN51_01150 [Akkermansiaceae bacterium]|nr:hypothetical protein [Akkermansiaceae bacterium]